jgi:hypothetical protein
MMQAYDIVYEGSKKRLISKNFNYIFDFNTGFTAKWGATMKEDPEWCEFGPEICDVEVTEICQGIGTSGPCSFCFPEGVEITTQSGDKKIEKIEIGDVNLSYNEDEQKLVHNKVLEVYSRQYSGVMVIIELENGVHIPCTPEHPVFVEKYGWVEAKNLTEDMEIKYFDE